jgi:hypothetical protein
MLSNIQRYFRYYLALVLTILLSVGVRMQAAPLGTELSEQHEVNDAKTFAQQADAVQKTLAAR